MLLPHVFLMDYKTILLFPKFNLCHISFTILIKWDHTNIPEQRQKHYYLNCYKKYVYKVEGYIFSGIDFLISKYHCFHEPFFYTNIIEP